MLKASCEISTPLTFLHHGACTEAEEKTRLQGKHQKEYTKFLPSFSNVYREMVLSKTYLLFGKPDMVFVMIHNQVKKV